MHLVARRKKEVEDKEKEFKGRRVSGSYSIQYFLDWMRDFVDEAADATKKLDKERVEALKASIADGSKKASAKENDALVEATKAEIKQPMTEKAIESKSGYDLTATMGGKLKFSTITKKDGFEPGVNEEIKVCKIPNILQEWIEAIGEV
jgi:anti-sigma28 factor (negative regulator of flagellin synthesis)